MIKGTFAAVWVEWNDACASTGWHSRGRIQAMIDGGLMHVKSLGWLIAETDDFYTLALSVSEDLAGELVNIPKAWVTDFRVLSDEVGEECS